MRFFRIVAMCSFALPAVVVATERPNILLILADDLGSGDVRCFNSESNIATPNLDRLSVRR